MKSNYAYFKREILRSMAAIESYHAKMFQDINPELDKKLEKVIGEKTTLSNLLFLKNELNKIEDKL